MYQFMLQQCSDWSFVGPANEQAEIQATSAFRPGSACKKIPDVDQKVRNMAGCKTVYDIMIALNEETFQSMSPFVASSYQHVYIPVL